MRRVAFVLALLFLSGCLAESPAAEGDPASGGPQADGAVTKDMELGRESKFTPGPGPHTFTVQVPEGGAKNVRWTLTIEGPAATSTVNGNGCSSNANVNVVVAVGATSTRSGSCADLPAGPAEFTVMLTDPALSFTALIHGSVAQPTA